MMDLRTAGELLDFSVRIGKGQRADEQLEGAVALHNILQERRVAYLADEVGMGKTYVALGAMALFRHMQPDFRVLIIAPRENIQRKWMKELGNFVRNNVRFADMRVKALDGRPARPMVFCNSLISLARESTLNPNRDFFARLTSFSLAVSGKEMVDESAAKRLKDDISGTLPWIRDEVFDRRNRTRFKDNVAKALCCALPPFDLVIVDEGHNLKHGFSQSVSARNRVLALAMGHPEGGRGDELFRGYGPRARRVLFLSATPVEETYRHLWNQLNVFGRTRGFEGLCKAEVSDEEKKALVRQVLIRRVTALKIGEEEHTKNLYRREWRRGGVLVHDEPIRVQDPRQRLVVALVQKKVSELLGSEQFGSSFQIGMLASFESFLQTAKLKRDDTTVSVFDDAEQTDNELARQGIDVADVNRLAGSYRRRFDQELPHPKMDALVDSLSTSWSTGRKSLVFVRRVASVTELKRKLDDRYDEWLIARLLRELPLEVHGRLQRAYNDYRREKQAAAPHGTAISPVSSVTLDEEQNDQGGRDTFFAWFFRGEGPSGIVSGANIQQRFTQRSAAFATFFDDNYVADLLGCEPGGVERALAEYLGLEQSELRERLRVGAAKFLTRSRRQTRADRASAAQGAAIELMKQHDGRLQERARVIWHQKFEGDLPAAGASETRDVGGLLELRTFFTELRKRPALRAVLWPEPSSPDAQHAFREQEMRAQLLATAARLGHSLIDLYVLTINRIKSVDLRAQAATESPDGEEVDVELSPITEFLDLLERRSNTPLSVRDWSSYDELSELAANFELILDVNEPDARSTPLPAMARKLGQLLRQQQPVGGMSGQVNSTLVRQFRMPGYPFVLLSTDLLQEGEDLHTFCSAVHHYGIAWTPSSMEQRIGRIDRVRSHSERRLLGRQQGALVDEDKLQVFFPHLEDTIEVLQVQRVLERMNTFLRLMHEGLITPGQEERSLDLHKEFAKGARVVEQISGRLKTAFPVTKAMIGTKRLGLSVSPASAGNLERRFASLSKKSLSGLDVQWEPDVPPGVLLGTAHVGDRVQPFSLQLQSFGARVVVRCVSPVGRVELDSTQDQVVGSAKPHSIRVGAIVTADNASYDLTVEDDVLLGETPESDRVRVTGLIRRVVEQADYLERQHLPGMDQSLHAFRADLEKEAVDGR